MKLKYLCLILPVFYFCFFGLALTRALSDSTDTITVVAFVLALTAGFFLLFWAKGEIKFNWLKGNTRQNNERKTRREFLFFVSGFLSLCLSTMLSNIINMESVNLFMAVLQTTIAMVVWYICFIPWRRTTKRRKLKVAPVQAIFRESADKS